jgi:hypothetical protein
MSDIEWPASELQVALDEQRERIESALHALNGGITIKSLQAENKRLREEVESRKRHDAEVGEGVRLLRAKAVEADRNPGRLLGYAWAARIGAGGDRDGGFVMITPFDFLHPSVDQAKSRPRPASAAPCMIVAVYEVRP